MRFMKIAIRKDGVELVRELVHANGDKQHIELEADGEPLPSFVDALQAFAPFVLDLLPITVDPTVPLTVTTLNLSVDKNGLRGVIVTATVPVERAAAASAASTRKPRRGKPKDFVPGVGPVVNPDATDVLTTDTLRQLLLSVERDVPVDAIAQWTSSERESAERWGRMRQRQIVGELKADEVMPKEPKCLRRDATPALSADEWTAPAPPHVTDDDLQALAIAKERG